MGVEVRLARSEARCFVAERREEQGRIQRLAEAVVQQLGKRVTALCPACDARRPAARAFIQ
ncbi:hypothetical protein ACIQ6Y_37590 [Streptomyces sp. NPDC096205]|uniref:hypothetical protein n=1 Tax=Streptomyces sp. NPDC096205 TaxID=3366081 RepID=UPI0037FB8AB4